VVDATTSGAAGERQCVSRSEGTHLNNKRLILWCCAVVGAASTVFWVLGIGLERVLDVDQHPYRLLAEVVGGVSVAAVCLARFYPSLFFISSAVPWRTLVGRMIIGAIVSYPVLAVCYAAGAAVFIGARGSLGERDAELFMTLLALWLPLWTLPLSAALFTWRRSVHIGS
jgi:hypothetical protein